MWTKRLRSHCTSHHLQSFRPTLERFEERLTPVNYRWLGACGSTVGDWNTPANWSPAGVPVAGDTAMFQPMPHQPNCLMVLTGSVPVNNGRLTIHVEREVKVEYRGSFSGNGTIFKDGLGQGGLKLAGFGSGFMGVLEVSRSFPATGDLIITGSYANATLRNTGPGTFLTCTGTVGPMDLQLRPPGGGSSFLAGRTRDFNGSFTPFTPGTCNTGSTGFDSFQFEALLTPAGNSRLMVNGNLTLSRSTLQVWLGYQPVPGTQFTIISASSISGTFASLPDGTVFTTANGTTLRINYTATSVVLTRLNQATQCRITTMPTAVAGTPFNVNVSALDANGLVEPGYRGTISLTTSDPRGTLPGPHTYTAGDQGVHTFPNAILRTAGSRTITARDAAANFSCTASVTVNPAAARRFTLTNLPAAVRRGEAAPFTVTAFDEFNNQATSYPGTVRFTSSDGQATVPFNATLANGTGAFSVTFRTLGSQSVNATDLSDGSITGSASTSVRSTAVRFVVSADRSTVTAGQAFNLEVSARNTDNTVDTNFNGTVRFSSNDGQASLPPTFTLTNGVGMFPVTLRTAGSRTVTATDTALASITGGTAVTVVPAALSRLLVTGLANPVTAGTPASFTVTASDPFGNRIVGYRGRVRLTSSDALANLPSDYSFNDVDNGSHTFTPGVTFNTLGTQSVTATDADNGTVTGTASTLVRSTTVALSVASPIATPSIGRAIAITVTARNAQGGADPSYRGTVTFSSSGPADLPENYTFTAADAGVKTFTVTLRTAGPQIVLVRDVTVPVVVGILQVEVTQVWSLSVTGLPASITAGTPVTVTIQALDRAGNFVNTYRGTVRFTSSDPRATLPPATPLNGGIGVFNVTFNFGGNHTLMVTDPANPQITGSASTQVRSTATFFTLTASTATPTAGQAFTITVTARNPNNTVDASYGGTVAFTSTDDRVSLPANYTFQSADQGVRTFSATLRTASFHSITARDTAVGSMMGMAFVTVSPAAASQFTVTVLPNPVFAGQLVSVDVIASDPFGNRATGYTGTVRLTSTDTQATLPGNYTFQTAEQGRHFFTATLRTAGPQTVTITDVANPALTGIGSTTVRPLFATRLEISGLAPSVVAGVPQTITVTARDEFGNRATGYLSAVGFASTDVQASLPSNYTFMTADQGQRAFTVTFRTAGPQSLTVRDIFNQFGATVNLTVNPGPVAYYYLYPDTGLVVTGQPFDLYVFPFDEFWNHITNYTGEIAFFSTDEAAVLPKPYTFQIENGGVAYFFEGVTFNTLGPQELYVFDTETYLVWGYAAYDVQGSGGAPGGGSSGKGIMPAEVAEGLPQRARTGPQEIDIGRKEREQCFVAPREVHAGVVESVLLTKSKLTTHTSRASVDDLFARLDREYTWHA